MLKQFKCSCGKITELNVPEDKWQIYLQGVVAVQNIFPDADSFYRETLINGTCYECQEKLFHRPAPGHEKEWGKYIGECACCGAPVRECDIHDGQFKCVSCKCTEYEED